MAALAIPLDGRICSQNVLSGPLTGGEAMEIVSSNTSAPATNANGNTFQVTPAVLGAFFAGFGGLNREVITAGGTFTVATNDTMIFVNKTIGGPITITMPLSSAMVYPGPVLIKDWKGDASTNNIAIGFSGGETCDGQASVVIKNDFGWVWMIPGPNVTGASGWALIG